MNVMSMGIDELRVAVQTLRPLAAEAHRLEQELDAIMHAARMPTEYPHGLPAWINKLQFSHETMKANLPRTEDVETIQRLTAIVDKLPKTADGVCILVAPDLHELCLDGAIVRVTGWYLYDDGIWGVRTWNDEPLRGFVTHVVIDNDNRIYSTHEAAEAELERRKSG